MTAARAIELLTKIADEMSHEVYRLGNHPALGVDREMVLLWRDLLTDATAALRSTRAPVREMTAAQESCGYCLYGEPAICTCGTCDVGAQEKEPDRCPASDYPVWADGSQDLVTCTLPVRHGGPHKGSIGTHEWTW